MAFEPLVKSSQASRKLIFPVRAGIFPVLLVGGEFPEIANRFAMREGVVPDESGR